MHSGILTAIMIFLGGGVGTLGRYGVAVGVRSAGADPRGFPVATLTVNVVGCFVIGLVAAAVAAGWGIREDLRLALVIGVLGGFTTFSSFGLETAQMWTLGHHGRAVAYVLASNALGIAAAFGAMALMAGRASA